MAAACADGSGGDAGRRGARRSAGRHQAAEAFPDRDPVPGRGAGRGRFRTEPIDVFGGRARLEVLWRERPEGWLVTVSLGNAQRVPPEDGDNGASAAARNQAMVRFNERALFEVGLDCVIEAGLVGPYPRADFHLLGDEKQ